jgi:hypothetical protein
MYARFFNEDVFPGRRMLPELMNGAISGCDGTVSDTGYSNTDIAFFIHIIDEMGFVTQVIFLQNFPKLIKIFFNTCWRGGFCPTISGCDGTVSDTGYSNTDIFTSYVKEHFLKYVQSHDSSQPVLLLYDGHRSHISRIHQRRNGS